MVPPIDAFRADVRVETLEETSGFLLTSATEATLLGLLLCHLLFCTSEYAVDHTISQGFGGSHPVVTITVTLDGFKGLA